ncbi:MAG TPA: DNA gyrase subunit A [Candidatus Krumholzibacteria bacterium]|jgi:DNA gyrase subunit A|nr:DNA gyrase subunit A [Candidatus Krumholzibacteria bacterium]
MPDGQERSERVVPVYIEDEMRTSYLDYSMSVIVSRALPDIRDGLKPVHRRILTAMHDLNLFSDRPYRKSAKITGDVTANYHPHGTQAAYETLVRMAQNFSLRYPLVDGQGNFGSVDGDPPAAERYTEARMSAIAGEMLADIDKDTVDYVPNYDNTREMPVVLPALVPNLLVNGAAGIAVGMATNIPPHNLGEIVDAVLATLDAPDMGLPELMRLVPGPDFPTGGIIFGREGIREAYATGRGRIIVRAAAEIETDPKSERERIVVTEIPYQVNKAGMIERIADLVKEGNLEGITDLRDESDRRGMRVVIELKKDANSTVILNKLFHSTQMQMTFGANMVALIDNKPRTVNLKEMIQHYIEHRKEVVVRRTRFDLRKAEERAHILEGLRIALDNIDELVALIRSSKDPAEASARMRERFGLSEAQAAAILDMRLQRLTGLERDKIEAEYRETLALIEKLRAILADPQQVVDIIKEELQALREKYGDARRTRIMDAIMGFEAEDLIADEDMVLTISHNGYIKRLPMTTYRQQRRGGRGIAGFSGQENDFVEHVFVASTHSYLLFFTDRGRCYWVKVHEVPTAGRTARGKAIVNILRLKDERVTSMIPVRDLQEPGFLVFATRRGVVKRCELADFSNPRPSGIIAIHLRENDELVGVALTRGDSQIVLAKRSGKAVRFKEGDVRAMGRAATGVRGATLESESDSVIGMVAVSRPEAQLLVVTEKGYGKRTALDAYRLTARGTKGVITLRVTGRNGPLVAIREVVDGDELMLITSRGTLIRLPVSGISQLGRATQGVHLVRLGEDDRVVAVAHIAREDEDVEAPRRVATPGVVSPEEQQAEAAAEGEDEEVVDDEDGADGEAEDIDDDV